MGLQTDDFVIKSKFKTEWTEIPLRNNGTFVKIIQIEGNSLYVKIGPNSNTEGFILEKEQTLIANESIFVRTKPGTTSIVTVIRDGD